MQVAPSPDLTKQVPQDQRVAPVEIDLHGAAGGMQNSFLDVENERVPRGVFGARRRDAASGKRLGNDAPPGEKIEIMHLFVIQGSADNLFLAWKGKWISFP